MPRVTFYFDLGSPYAYLTAERLSDVLDEPVAWQPLSLGALFKLSGRSSWSLGDARRRREGIAEIERRAGAYGLPPMQWPQEWPTNYLMAMRAATFAFAAGRGREFTQQAFRDAFQRGHDLSIPARVLDAAEQAGLDRGEVESATGEPHIKQALREATDAAHGLGVIGVPTIAIDSVTFWGDDHLEDAAAYLRGSSRSATSGRAAEGALGFWAMGETAEYSIGSEVTCSDGICGELSRVVVDPVARILTHLVVDPKHRQGQGRLVPIDLVEATAEEIRLRCTTAEFDALEDAEETRFLPDVTGDMGYGSGETYSWPYYGIGGGAVLGMGGPGIGGEGLVGAPQFTISDRVPKGEVEVGRGEPVQATDGHIGRVQGLVIDPKDHHVTHVLLEEGHLWGKKTVTIPIGAVQDVTVDGVRLSLTKDQVRDLPAVGLDRHG